MSRTQDTDATCSGWHNGGCTGTPHCPPRCPRFFDSEGVPVSITPFESDDFDALASMYDALDPENRSSGLPPRRRADIDAWLETMTDDGWNLLARADGHVVGHVGVTPAGAAEPELVIFVADEYQGRGIGTELIKQLVAYADDRGHDSLHLAVERANDRAIAVYENLSFEVAEEDMATVAMRLQLDNPIAEDVQRPPAER